MDTSTAAIDLQDVTKRFGHLVAVDGVSLTVHPGEVVALLGPNGAGKSTLTEMLLGIAEPDAGGVRVFGTSPHEAARRGMVGAMLQGGALLDNVRVAQLLRLVRAVQAHPLPLAEVVERADIADLLRANTSRLSGGQAQRVRHALAIMADPRLLLLDEPTVALDVAARHRFWQDMRQGAASGRTVVFATHYLEEADEFADRVVVLHRGRVVADGTGAAIRQRVVGRRLSFGTESHTDWQRLPGATGVEVLGGRVVVRTSDSDAALRRLLELDATDALGVHDIEVDSPSLEDAFVELVS